MKKFITIFTLLLAAAVAQAALPQPELIAKIHFAGAQNISADTNATNFAVQFCSPEALALRAQTADKLCVWLAGWLQAKTGVAVAGGAAKLRPLFDDLQTAEWLLEARAVAGQPQMVLAIKLAADRAPIWQANLKSFFAAASVNSTDGWLVFSSSPDAPKLGDRRAQEYSQTNPAWFTADINWPQLAAWYPQLKALALPETKLQVSAIGGDLHLAGTCFFPNNLSLDLESWRMPTNTVRQPFVSFTAVRGFSAWLPSQAWAKPYLVTPVPNQLFVWALPQIPYQTFAAIPFANAPGALAQAYQRLQPVFSSPNPGGGIGTPLTLVQTNDEVRLQGTPFIAPFIQAIREPAGQFLLAGLFPNTPRSQPLPPELFQRLAATNLVLYHWEITADRLPQALNLSQLGFVLTARRQLGGDSAAMKWIQKVSPSLGNSVTEIKQTGPDQFTFSRKATGVFTAVELLALGNWLEAPDFPHCTLKLPPRPVRPKPQNGASTVLPAPIPAK